jgi:hypothetical protein
VNPSRFKSTGKCSSRYSICNLRGAANSPRLRPGDVASFKGQQSRTALPQRYKEIIMRIGLPRCSLRLGLSLLLVVWISASAYASAQNGSFQCKDRGTASITAPTLPASSQLNQDTNDHILRNPVMASQADWKTIYSYGTGELRILRSLFLRQASCPGATLEQRVAQKPIRTCSAK